MIKDSVFHIDEVLSHRMRHKLIATSHVLLSFSVFAAIVTFAHEPFKIYFGKAFGVTLILLSFRFGVAQLEMFYRSIFFRERSSTFEYERLLYKTKKSSKHPLIVFLESSIGAMIMVRAGVPRDAIKEFIKNHPLNSQKYDQLLSTHDMSLSVYIEALYEHHKDFADFLFRYGIHGGDLSNIATWYENQLDKTRRYEFWWGIERLREHKGFGKQWAFSDTWKLDRYSYTISDNPSIFKSGMSYYVRSEEVAKVEAVLSKREVSNTIIVGPPGVGKKEALKYLAYKVETGQINKRLQYKRVVLFNALFLVSGKKTKGDFETALIGVLNDVVHAGNIILVIDDFAEFIASAEEVGSDASAIIEKYVGSDKMHIVALSDTYGFQAKIEPKRDLMSHFEKISVEEPTYENSLLILEERVEELEAQHSVMFSYLAIKETLDGAKRYYVDSTMPEKALELLEEVMSWAVKNKIGVVLKKDIIEVLKEKTSIPMGEIDPQEKDRLLHLEESLHERVVGQEEAISTVSDALRRARTDIQNTSRPVGSFLFLGPTGVGKTETAKTLARVFFGGEEHMLRIDMSEFKGADGIKKMIGSFEEGKAGVLANMLREHPYGVLLLDEFEKASSDVHDLFLRIFDEGIFSDMRGRKVNARNIIFIVTSNAGSDLIFQAIQEGVNLSSMKETIIDTLITRKVFKPELINRFDAVTLFHPLEESHLQDVAKILLEELRERLEEKHIKLTINQILIDTAVKFGHDPRFGAREMRRAIKEKIENKIAEKIIKGEVAEGQALELSEEDLI